MTAHTHFLPSSDLELEMLAGRYGRVAALFSSVPD